MKASEIDGYKIIQFTAENVKKLTLVQITPAGNVVQITGKNGQGKTSVLDAIWWALAGVANIQSQPIRKGAESARIELALGKDKVELIVERRFTESQSYLTVKTPDGARYPSPQKLLEDLLGVLTFDPLAFMRKDARGQFDVLRGLVKLSVDLDALKTADRADYDARTIANRDAKSKRAQAQAVHLPPDLPKERIDEAGLLDQLTSASSHNSAIDRLRETRAQVAAKVKKSREQAAAIEQNIETEIAACQKTGGDLAAEIERQIEALQARFRRHLHDVEAAITRIRTDRQAEVDTLRTGADVLQNELNHAPSLPDPIDVDALRSQIGDAQGTNRLIAQREQRQTIEADVEKFEKRSKTLSDQIDARNRQRMEALAAAQMPIEGLAFGDGIVLYRDLPLDQASDAEQLTVSTAIAAALNPKLRVLRIRDGSLLDDDAMKRLAQFADDRDFQIWVERVDGSGTVGIVMEDGHVRGHEPDPDHPREPFIKGDMPALPFLTPVNFSAQLRCTNDEAAKTLAEYTIREICDGQLSPDTDWIREWVRRFGNAMIKSEYR